MYLFFCRNEVLNVACVRFIVENNSEADQTAFLELTPNTLNFDVYSDNSTFLFSKQRLAAEMPLITSLQLNQGQLSTFYIRVSSNSTLNPDVYLSSIDKLIYKSITTSRVNHFLMSCFILLALCCFVLAAAYKEYSLAIYGIYNASWVFVMLYSYHYLVSASFLGGYTAATTLAISLNSVIFLGFSYPFLKALLQETLWKIVFFAFFILNLSIVISAFFFSGRELFFAMLIVIFPTHIFIVFASTFYYFRYLF